MYRKQSKDCRSSIHFSYLNDVLIILLLVEQYSEVSFQSSSICRNSFKVRRANLHEGQQSFTNY